MGSPLLSRTHTTRLNLNCTRLLLLSCQHSKYLKMRPPTRNIINLAHSICLEGPLAKRAPIGRISEGRLASSRQFSAFAAPHASNKARLRSTQCTTQQAISARRSAYQFRSQYTNHGPSPGPKWTAKRSDTKPLLGAVVGATALAFIGTSIASRESVEDVENPIKSDDDVDIEDTHGKLMFPLESSHSAMISSTRRQTLISSTRCSEYSTC